jgi:hypothetical protein
MASIAERCAKGSRYFTTPSAPAEAKRAIPILKMVGERLAEWVRSLKIEGVAPNHGWRHRFSSLARHVDVHIDVQNILQDPWKTGRLRPQSGGGTSE